MSFRTLCAGSSGAESPAQRGRVRKNQLLGQPAYLAAKAKGDNRMPVTREAPEGV